jgi:uncharacterized protein (TIGR02300 family)
MPAKDLGTKHTCWKCGTKFYDLKKADPACPKCGADPRQAPVTKSPASEKRSRAKPPVETPEVEEADLDEAIDDVEDEPEEAADDEEP